MSFNRKTIVKKPRKPHQCDLCYGVIDGEHVYQAWAYDNELYSSRLHVECSAVLELNCSKCQECGCDVDMFECARINADEGDIPKFDMFYKGHPKSFSSVYPKAKS